MISFNKPTDTVLIQPLWDKIAAVRNLQEPKSKTEVQSLVGFLSQLSGFIPEIKVCCPNIKKLTSKYNQFQWLDIHREELKTVKNKLETVIPLTPIDTSSPLILHTDASTEGIGWVLSQLRTKEGGKIYMGLHTTL